MLLRPNGYLQISREKKHWFTIESHNLKLISDENNSFGVLASNIDHEAGSLETKSSQGLNSNIDHETHTPMSLGASQAGIVDIFASLFFRGESLRCQASIRKAAPGFYYLLVSACRRVVDFRAPQAMA